MENFRDVADAGEALGILDARPRRAGLSRRFAAALGALAAGDGSAAARRRDSSPRTAGRRSGRPRPCCCASRRRAAAPRDRRRDPLAALRALRQALALRAELVRVGPARRRRRCRGPSISVGNLTFGGTGKTPFVEFLARRLRFEGWRPGDPLARLRPALARRRRRLGGGGPAGRRRARAATSRSPSRARVAGVLVVVAERRAEAARRAADLGADLLPAGRRVPAPGRAARRRTCCCSTRGTPSAAGAFRPRGRLREPVAALRRADAFVFTRVDRGRAAAGRSRAIARLAPGRARLSCAHPRRRACATRTARRSTRSRCPPRRCLAVCGVAQPAEIRRDAARARPLARGAPRVPRPPALRRRGTSRGSATPPSAAGASFVLTTEKDAVKLAGRIGLPIVTVRLGVEVEEPGFFPFLAARLPARRRSPA